MKIAALCFAVLVPLAAASVSACPLSGVPPGKVDDISVVAPSFSISDEDGQRTITTLATLKNASADCLDGIVVEVRYLDGKGSLIDSVTQLLYGVVAPPNNDVAVRVRDVAARPKEAYASQEVRVVSAESRSSRGAKSQAPSSPMYDLLISWAPMLLLIAVWIFFMQRMKRSDSPQGKTLLLIEEQNRTLVEQNAMLARIASALEARAAARDGG